VEVVGHDQLYMTKAQIVRAAIASGEFEGNLELCDRRGAAFRLRPVRRAESTAVGLGIETSPPEPLRVVEEDHITPYKPDKVRDHLRAPRRTYPEWSPAACSEAETFVDSVHDVKEAEPARVKSINDDDGNDHLRPAHAGSRWSPAVSSKAETFVDSIDDNEKKDASQYKCDLVDPAHEPLAAPDVSRPKEPRPNTARRGIRRMRRLLTSCFGLESGVHREYPKVDDGC
jgi:hypothetical protein